jgi:hypothetical protein
MSIKNGSVNKSLNSKEYQQIKDGQKYEMLIKERMDILEYL